MRLCMHGGSSWGRRGWKIVRKKWQLACRMIHFCPSGGLSPFPEKSGCGLLVLCVGEQPVGQGA